MPASDLISDPLLEKAPLREGYKVLGGVVLYQKLGQGGMGAVYRGKHLRLEVDVALKVMAVPAGIHPEQAANNLQRFVREAKTAASVRHQNLIRVYDVNSEHGVDYLVMDFIDGESAGDRLKRRALSGEKKLSEQEAAEICLGAAEGLAAAHEASIVHRDVKPDNILIDKKGNTVVADLGLAKAFGGESDSALSMGLSLTQQAMGTPYYMAPEQTRSAKDVGPQADVWSLGVTLYQLASGQLPWSDTDLSDLIQRIRNSPAPDIKRHCDGLSDGLCAIMDKAMRKDAAERYADCAEMAAALADHLDAISTSRKSVLPDAEAGQTKMALVTLTPPPSKTLTLIGKTMLRPSDSARMSAQQSPAPAPDTAKTVEGPPPARAAGSQWVVPAAVTAGVLLLALVLWALFGGRREETAAPRLAAAPTVSLEKEAQGFLDGILALADSGYLDEAKRKIDEAGSRYDATPAGPQIARLAETIATKIAAMRRAKEEEDRRAQEKEVERRAKAVASAGQAEEDGNLDEALRLLKDELSKRDDPELRRRVEELERAVAALRLIEEGTAAEEAGDLEAARDAYRRAIQDAAGEGKRQAEERLAGVERRIRVRKTLDEIAGRAEAGDWRATWGLIDKARKEGVDDPSLDELRRKTAAALSPPKKLAGPLGVEFVLVAGGAFRMGTDSGGRHERPVHKVTLSPFYIGRCEVTKAQYRAFTGKRRDARGVRASDAVPIVSVTWQGACDFCEYLKQLDQAGSTCRLPTEAEWEFAARGPSGKKTGRTYPWGDERPGSEHANLAGGGDGFERLAPVGSFPKGATPEGAMDLVGNAAEWCLDWYGRYAADAQTDPRGPEKGKARVVRGSAWAYDAKAWSRASARTVCDPEERKDTVGFRVVRELTDEEKRFLRIAGGG